MRFTTKLSVLITLLAALAMFLMLLGSSFSFYEAVAENTQFRWRAIATTIDHSLLDDPPESLDDWIPVTMQAAGGIKLELRSASGILYEFDRPTDYHPWDTLNVSRSLQLPLLQHPGTVLRVEYVDPISSYSQSLSSTLAMSVSILVMIGVILFSLRWLRTQTQGLELLEKRAKRILLSSDEYTETAHVEEWPHAVSGVLDKLQKELNEAREERTRVDTLIRSFAALDAETGLNNRLFFDNQLATRLEEPGEYGVVMMVRLPDFDLLRDRYESSEVAELQYALINMLSTFVMRYPSALLARYFHSDFSILLPHSSLKEADTIAGQLVKSATALPWADKFYHETLITVGIAAYRSGQSLEQVIDHLEQATRNAGLQGDNGWFIHDENVPEVRRGSVRWRTLLEQTLSKGGPLLYQKPAIFEHGRVDHREITPRVLDNDQILLPAEFMPLVQQLGLSERFDRQMLGKMLPLLQRWPDEVLAIELTVDALLSHSFRVWLRDHLMQLEKAQRERLIFELAEADVCKHIDRLRPVIRLLLALGGKISVTQAGLTVVSTSYLKRLQIEVVKLHPGLVRNIEKRVENQLFLRSLVEACKSAGVRVFAAGVRSKQEWVCLKENGVQGGQGDFFASAEAVGGGTKKYSHHYRI